MAEGWAGGGIRALFLLLDERTHFIRANTFYLSKPPLRTNFQLTRVKQLATFYNMKDEYERVRERHRILSQMQKPALTSAQVPQMVNTVLTANKIDEFRIHFELLTNGKLQNLHVEDLA